MPAAVRPILLLTFVNALGGMLLIPVLPFVVRDLGYNDVVYSLLIAAYPAAQFFAAPILGGYADYRGRRPVLLISQFGTMLSWVLFGAAYFIDGAGLALAVIVASRIVDGLTGGNQSVAAAYLADVVEGDQRTRVFSMQGAIAGVALLLGPSLGSYSAASSVGFLGTAIVAVAISTLTLIGLFTIPESLDETNRAASFDRNPFHQLNLVGKARTLTGAPTLIRLFSIGFLVNVMLSLFSTVAVLWYVDGLGLSASSTGLMFLATGAFLIFNEMVTLRFFERTLGDVGTLVVGLCVSPIALALLSLPRSVPTFLALSFLLNVGFALILPTLQSVLTRSADEREEGVAQGINTSVAAIASTVAPIAAGALYAFGEGPASFLVGAAVATVGALLGVSSASLLREAIGESAPSHDHTHRHFGPVHALTQKLSLGRGHFGMRLHGDSLEHHCVRTSNVRSDG
jgi:MFS family permease